MFRRFSMTALLISSLVGPKGLNASTFDWVGYPDNSCISVTPDAAFEYGGVWDNFTPPVNDGTATVRFGSGLNPYGTATIGYHVYFGDFCHGMPSCPSPIQEEQVDFVADRFLVQSGSWTLDMGWTGAFGCSPSETRNGSLTLTGGTPSLVIGESRSIDGVSGNASATMRGNGVVTTPNLYIGSGVGNEGSLRLEDSLSFNSGEIRIGSGGTGTLELAAGASMTVNSANVHIGAGAGAEGTFIVEGIGTLLSGPSRLLVGGWVSAVNEGGDGLLIVRDNGMISANDLRIGGNGTGEALITTGGYYDATQGSCSIASGPFGSGIPQAGELRITQGGRMHCSNGVQLAGDEVGDALMVVSGSGSEVDAVNDILVGEFGIGELELEQGGLIMCRSLNLGRQPTGSGFVSIRNAATLFHCDDVVRVGDEGLGELTLTSFARLESTNGTIGEIVGSSGELLMSGSSQWNLTGVLTVAVDGDATLLVSSSSEVTADSLVIGKRSIGLCVIETGGKITTRLAQISGTNANADGTVFVCGAESEFEVMESCRIGDGAHGELALSGNSMATALQFDVLQNGTLSGDGNVVGQVHNHGIMNPQSIDLDNPGTPPDPGALTVSGDFQQFTDGRLQITWHDTSERDQINLLGGTATLSGTINISLAVGFDPPVGATATIISAMQVIGTFSQSNLPQTPNGKRMILTYDADAVRLTIIEPGDIDDNGTVDEQDAALFVTVLLGFDSDSRHILFSDLNDDGEADGGDVQWMVQALLD